MGIKLIITAIFLFAGTGITLGQTTGKDVNEDDKNEDIKPIRPDYVLNIKLKKKLNSRKMEITSMKYEKRPSKIFRMLADQKERILNIKENIVNLEYQRKDTVLQKVYCDKVNRDSFPRR